MQSRLGLRAPQESRRPAGGSVCVAAPLPRSTSGQNGVSFGPPAGGSAQAPPPPPPAPRWPMGRRSEQDARPDGRGRGSSAPAPRRAPCSVARGGTSATLWPCWRRGRGTSELLSRRTKAPKGTLPVMPPGPGGPETQERPPPSAPPQGAEDLAQGSLGLVVRAERCVAALTELAGGVLCRHLSVLLLLAT